MELMGGCQCGSVRYRVTAEPQHVTLCHCSDCRKSAGAPLVAWAGFAEGDFAVTAGEPVSFNSSGASFRSFCGKCGTGLIFRNQEMLPGIVDIQCATLDDPEQLPPSAHIQAAEELNWMKSAHELPRFERFPSE